MKSVQYADVRLLPTGTVLLIDTEDECFKLIVGNTDTHISLVDQNTEEEEPFGVVNLYNLVIGEPMIGIEYTFRAGTIFKTTPIKVIEIYSDE